VRDREEPIREGEAHVALRSSEERYRRVVENTSEGVWIYDTHGVTTFMNARIAQMLGYTVAEAVGLNVFAFIAPSAHADARRVWIGDVAARASGATPDFVARTVRSSRSPSRPTRSSTPRPPSRPCSRS
jgi:PAS domain-containing protein